MQDAVAVTADFWQISATANYRGSHPRFASGTVCAVSRIMVAVPINSIIFP